MTHEEIIDELNDLIKLDFDAVQAYNQAIEEIDVPTIRNELTSFRTDHERHVTELTNIVRRYGGEPAEQSRDVTGFLIEGITAVRSKMGTEGALNAMRSNEQLTNREYQNAVSLDLPMDILAELEANFFDEQRHLQYIEQTINGRMWEPSEARYH
jgi:uncharacterized protein (TIGR02284 family)